MEAWFWHTCWEKDHIGFHQDEYHPLLLRHFKDWAGDGRAGVFVPLCGKSLDMHYIARNHRVMGSELSEIACKDFFTEAGLDCHFAAKARFNSYRGEHIELLAGDFFALEPADVENCPLIYDRAALVALPPNLRNRYVDKLRRLYPGGGKLFLLTLEYPPGEIDGPPFEVSQEEVERLFAGCSIRRVETLELEDGKFARRTFKVSWMREAAYFIQI